MDTVTKFQVVDETVFHNGRYEFDFLPPAMDK